MSLVNDDGRVLGQLGIRQEEPEQHSVRHVVQDRLVTRAVLETNRVPDFVPDSHADLLRDSSGDRHGGDSTRLGAGDLEPVLAVAGFHEVLGELGRLARSGFGLNDEDLVLGDSLEELLPECKNGKGLPDGGDGLG